MMTNHSILSIGWIGKALTWAIVGIDLTIALPELLALVFITVPVGILTWWKVYDRLKKKHDK